MMLNFRAPAKLNLFLNIVKKRSDGYHDIQSIFHLIDLYDELSFKKRKDNLINLSCNNKKIVTNNIIIEAINTFLEYTGVKKIGMDIYLKKNIPIGGGLGGGSSDAATCLIALNELYNTKLKFSQLNILAKKIGSDVPFFLYNKSAWVEGTGDIVTPIFVRPSWFILIFSKHNVSTTQIFSKYKIKSHYKNYSYDDYMMGVAKNDFENIVFKEYPSIYESYKKLSSYGHARMTGSGGTVFLPQKSLLDAEKVLSCLPKKEKALIVKSLDI